MVQAKAVLMTTGGTNRLFQNPTGLSFNIWMCPANTGDGEAMAFRTGAGLANAITAWIFLKRMIITGWDKLPSIEPPMVGFRPSWCP